MRSIRELSKYPELKVSVCWRNGNYINIIQYPLPLFPQLV